MADYETSKYSIPSTANAIIPGSAIQTDSIEAAEINANAVGSSELANNAVDTSAIVDGNVTGIKIANSTISIDKLNASGTRNVGTFLSGNNTFEAVQGGANTTTSTVANLSVSAGGHGATGTVMETLSTPSNNGVVIIGYDIGAAKSGGSGSWSVNFNISGSGFSKLISSDKFGNIANAPPPNGSQSPDANTSGHFVIASFTGSGTMTFTATISGGGNANENVFEINNIKATFIS